MRRRPRGSVRAAMRGLAAACVGLALICVVLAIAWTREHAAAACWREALRHHDTFAVAEGDCTP